MRAPAWGHARLLKKSEPPTTHCATDWSPISADPVLSAELEILAREIAAERANHEQRELTARIAEAQIDLMRVRRARHDLLARAHSNPNYQSPADDAMRLKILRQLLRTAPDKPIPDEFRELFGALQGPDKFATILSDVAARLSVMDRYERRCRGANSQFARSMRGAGRSKNMSNQRLANELLRLSITRACSGRSAAVLWMYSVRSPCLCTIAHTRDRTLRTSCLNSTCGCVSHRIITPSPGAGR